MYAWMFRVLYRLADQLLRDHIFHALYGYHQNDLRTGPLKVPFAIERLKTLIAVCIARGVLIPLSYTRRMIGLLQ